MTIDVIIPVRNGEQFIAECLESVLKQSKYTSITRILVVNDGSTDRTARIVENLKMRISKLELFSIEPSGLSAARNFGLSKATSSNVAFLDSDDKWLEHKLELHISHLEIHPECMFSFTSSLEFIDGSDEFRPQGKNSTEASFNSILLQDYRIYGSGSSVFANRHSILSEGGFDTNLSFGEDWDLWLKLASKHVPCEIPEAGTLIRIHPSSMQRATKYGDKRFLNSDIHFREWTRFPSIFTHPNFRSRAINVLWTEIRRNLDFRFILSNDLRDFHRLNHFIILDNIGLARTRFFKSRIFAMKLIEYLRGLND